MKQFFTSLIMASFLFVTGLADAQTGSLKTGAAENTGKNLFKVNVPAVLLNNYSFEYERAVGKKISAGLGFRFMPKSGIPFKGTVENLIDDDETWNDIKDLRTSNFAFTPEVKFYFGQSVFRGFYIAPFAKIASYKADLPNFKYDVDVTAGGQSQTYTETIPLSGTLNTVTGGVLFGAQWKLSKLLYLDWWILGPQFGHANGDISGKKELNQYEQQALRDELNDLDIPMVDTETHVDEHGGRLDMKGPWAGLRAGVNLGVRF